MEYSELTPEQKAKARACKTPEEILALAREEGYELSEAELEAVSGGWMSCSQESFCYMVEYSKKPSSGGASGEW